MLRFKKRVYDGFMKIDGIKPTAHFLGHIFGGIVIFCAVAIAATFIDNLAAMLQQKGASEFTLLTMKYLSHVMMIVDSLLVVFLLIFSSIKFCSSLWKGNPQ
jgi:hypothetical protein